MTAMGDKARPAARRVRRAGRKRDGRAGVELTDAKRRWSATVRADGSIECDGQTGSIHEVGADAAGRAVVQRLDLLACRARRASSSRSMPCGSGISPRYSGACAPSSARPASSIRPSAMTARSRDSPAGCNWFAAVELLSRRRPAPGRSASWSRSRGSRPARRDHGGGTGQALTAPRPPLQLGERTIRLDQPQVMGIVNATPDSFSDGGQYADAAAAARGRGDDGEARRGDHRRRRRIDPTGREAVWEGDEIERVLPVVQQLAASGTAVSIDTRKSGVMTPRSAPVRRLVNDVSALTCDPRSAEVVAAAGVPVVLMHHQGSPETMQDAPRYDDVLVEVYHWLEERIAAAEAAGIGARQILVDPGIGFGKSSPIISS